jgi:hypothetical protein
MDDLEKSFINTLIDEEEWKKFPHDYLRKTVYFLHYRLEDIYQWLIIPSPDYDPSNQRIIEVPILSEINNNYRKVIIHWKEK